MAESPPRGARVTGNQIAFGLKLRHERERRKISLACVAETIKIKQSLLVAIERGDASQWPPGIYRRALLREYAAAVGLPGEPTVSEFVRLFPESGVAVPDYNNPPDAGSELRLTLAPGRRWPTRPVARRLTAALLDGSAVLAIGAALGMLTPVDLWIATVILAVSYYSVATAWLGHSPALWFMNSVLVRRPNISPARTAPGASSRERLHIVSTTTRPDVWSPQHEPPSSFVENPRSASR